MALLTLLYEINGMYRQVIEHSSHAVFSDYQNWYSKNYQKNFIRRFHDEDLLLVSDSKFQNISQSIADLDEFRGLFQTQKCFKVLI